MVNRFAGSVIADSSALLALISEDVEHHDWAVAQWDLIDPPALLCEAVISEAAFLLKREGAETDALFEFLETGAFEIAFSVADHLHDVRALMKRYQNLPMAFADACIVRMAELNQNAIVFTLDSDFTIYRKHGNKVIPLLMPPRK